MPEYPWDMRHREERRAQLARILGVSVEAVMAREADMPRRIAVVMEWEGVKRRLGTNIDYVGRRAIAVCQRRGLSVAEVGQAEDAALLGLYGLGPGSVRFLRRLLGGEATPEAPPPPIPWWVSQE